MRDALDLRPDGRLVYTIYVYWRGAITDAQLLYEPFHR